MPIRFLKNIKLKKNTGLISLNIKDVVGKNFSNPHLIGAYVFHCAELKGNQPIFNDGIPSVILMPEPDDEVHLKKSGKKLILKNAWVCCGVIQKTYWEVPEGLEYIIVLRFKPSSFYSIFNVHPNTIKKSPVFSLQDIVDERWSDVLRKYYQLKGISEKIEYWDSQLAGYNTEGYLPYILEHAIEHIESARGNTSVSDLLKILGTNVNQKWLQRNFVKYIGLSPKKYISLQRFIFTYGKYEEGKSENLFGVALSQGYYDYNHFFKDFKQYMGIAPTRFTWD